MEKISGRRADSFSDMGLSAVENLSQQIKALAAKHGFLYCGFSKADFLESEAPRLESWLKRGLHGEMRYMENHFDKRLDPRKLVPGCKTVVTLLYNYFPTNLSTKKDEPQIAKYAWGEDYHKVIKDKLHLFLADMRSIAGSIEGRVFVDSAPILEKAWAVKSGAGWMGKNTNLLRKSTGSFFFLAEMLIDIELHADHPQTDHCGTCTACIDACPTGALDKPYELDAQKCISYLTIELRKEIPQAFHGHFENWMFGCDICQDVCPWNRFSQPHSEPRFEPLSELRQSRREWLEMTEEVFQSVFAKSPLQRPGLEHIRRTIQNGLG